MARIWTLLCIWGLWAGLGASAYGQVTVVLTKVPSNTPESDTLYITGEFNEWAPGDRAYAFQRQPEGTYTYTFANQAKPFEYKVTRGSWEAVEGDIHGQKLGNRRARLAGKAPYTESIQVLSWEDLAKVQSWDIVVQSVPENTPFDAPVFISGNFNGWAEADPAYRLARMDDGRYAVKISKGPEDTLLFKFNRGSWSAVEARASGRQLPNRMALWKQGRPNMELNVQIEAWTDLGGSRNLLLLVGLLLGAGQGLLLALSLQLNKDTQTRRGRALALLSAITALSLLMRLSVYSTGVFHWMPKLYLLSDLAYVVYAPALFYFLRELMGAGPARRWVPYFFAGGTLGLLALYIPLLVMPSGAFIRALNGQYIQPFLTTVSALAGAYNLVAVGLCLAMVSLSNASSLRDRAYREARTVAVAILVQAGLWLLLWLVAGLVLLASDQAGFAATGIPEFIIDAAWLAFALSPYVAGMLALRYPHLLRVATAGAEAAPEAAPPPEELAELKAQLAALLESQKPYLNPKLTLDDLAGLMHVHAHTLSWVINEGFGKNFYDLINEMRIEEFVRLSQMDKYRHYTFLAIAFEAGFNAKTTFNRVFKKHTGRTPREYFGELRMADAEDGKA